MQKLRRSNRITKKTQENDITITNSNTNDTKLQNNKKKKKKNFRKK
jgi:hypothetical protein